MPIEISYELVSDQHTQLASQPGAPLGSPLKGLMQGVHT